MSNPNKIEVNEFNNNIRCIEISCEYQLLYPKKLFNNNIRCIEMFVNVGADGEGGRFNNNIRCIEITFL